MGLALRAEHAPQGLLGRGLADRTGHRDHLALEAGARRNREFDEAGQHVIDHQKRRIGGELVALGAFDHGERRTGFQRGRDERMAVMDVALDREISLARRDGPGVDRKPRDRLRQHALHRGVHRLRHRSRCP